MPGEESLEESTETAAPMLVNMSAKKVPTIILTNEVLQFSEINVQNVLPAVLSPSSVLCSLILECEDVLENLEVCDSAGNSPYFSRSPMSMKTSSRLEERMLYSAIFSSLIFASTFLNKISKNSPRDFGTVYTVLPDSSIALVRLKSAFSVFQR